MNVYRNRIYNKERKRASARILKQILCHGEARKKEASRRSKRTDDEVEKALSRRV